MPNDAETASAGDLCVLADCGDTSLAVFSSASESGAVPSRRDSQRVKSRLIHMSEHLREKLRKTKQALDAETEERKQEAPTLQKLLEGRNEKTFYSIPVGPRRPTGRDELPFRAPAEAGPREGKRKIQMIGGSRPGEAMQRRAPGRVIGKSQ